MRGILPIYGKIEKFQTTNQAGYLTLTNGYYLHWILTMDVTGICFLEMISRKEVTDGLDFTKKLQLELGSSRRSLAWILFGPVAMPIAFWNQGWNTVLGKRIDIAWSQFGRICWFWFVFWAFFSVAKPSASISILPGASWTAGPGENHRCLQPFGRLPFSPVGWWLVRGLYFPSYIGDWFIIQVAGESRTQPTRIQWNERGILFPLLAWRDMMVWRCLNVFK